MTPYAEYRHLLLTLYAQRCNRELSDAAEEQYADAMALWWDRLTDAERRRIDLLTASLNATEEHPQEGARVALGAALARFRGAP